MKTIVCPACNAEQAIDRQQGDYMNCVFCGDAIQPLPPYEQGEEFSGENDLQTCQQSPQGKPIEAMFVLTREDVAATLHSVGRLKSGRGIVVFETILIGIFLVVQMINIVYGLMGKPGYSAPNIGTYATTIVFALLIPVVWLIPWYNEKKILDRSTSERQMTLQVYENQTEVTLDGATAWHFLHSGGYGLRREKKLLVILFYDGRILPVPERALGPDEIDLAVRRWCQGAVEESALSCNQKRGLFGGQRKK